VTRRRGVRQAVLRGLCCLAGSLVALGLMGNRAEKPAPTASLDLGEVPVHVRDAASPIVQQDLGEQTFRQQCAPCHGEKGRGDGPAAVAFNPRPADFTNPEGVVKMTDDELLEVITKGRAAMPAFEAILNEEARKALVSYIRLLSRGTKR
jgi:mono/diheme cytochrome c family protein